MTTAKDDAFDNADYYSTDEDCETLEHEHPVIAIEYLVDGYGVRDQQIASVLDEIDDVTVYAYRRKAVPESEWQSLGERAAECMQEQFDDEYGGGDETVLSRQGVDEKTLGKELGEVFRRHLGEDPVWQCVKVAERVYTRAEVEALMREENPGWFE